MCAFPCLLLARFWGSGAPRGERRARRRVRGCAALLGPARPSRGRRARSSANSPTGRARPDQPDGHAQELDRGRHLRRGPGGAGARAPDARPRHLRARHLAAGEAGVLVSISYAVASTLSTSRLTFPSGPSAKIYQYFISSGVFPP